MLFKKNILFIALTISLSSAFSQSTIKGSVVDKLTGKPVSFANIYLASTTFGSGSDVEGNFIFKVNKKGKYDLIVSSIGYINAHVAVVINNDSTFAFIIQLPPSSKELNDVVIQADTSHRKRDFRDFEKNFLGETSNSSSCDILNPKDIYVYRDEIDNTLVAFAKKPIVVKNVALGYAVYYDLEKFEALKPNVSIIGALHFQELPAETDRQKKRWEKARKISYEGSLTHLMHCIRTNQLREEGWEVLLEYPELRPSDEFITGRIDYHRERNNDDSLQFYRSLRLQKSGTHIISMPISGKELLDKDKIHLVFKGRLLIVYKRERDERIMPTRSTAQPNQVSIIKVLGQPITLFENGYFEPQHYLFIEGYLGFAERVSEFLPYDYSPIVDPNIKHLEQY